MTDRELMQMALDALKSDCDATKFGVSEALRARLAQPEPVIQARKEGDLIVADLPQVPRGSGGIIKDEKPKPILPGGGAGSGELTIDGWPLWSGLPDEKTLKKVMDKLPTMSIKVAENPTKPTKAMLIPALLKQAGYVKKKEWVNLTEDEIEDLTSVMFEEPSNEEVIDFALRVQAKLKEKNGG